jgi:3-deoxy-manno-octulosonate cytidylyltransferase (CMP-KDO synthetase)
VKPRVLAVIPARLGSTRFPRKVIHNWQGRPLLTWLVEELNRSKQIDRLVVATDSKEVRTALNDEVEVVMTSKRHRTGSDRAAEVLDKAGGKYVLNIQADNFGLKAAVVDRIIGRFMNDRAVDFATIVRRIEDDEDLFDPNTVKVVTSKDKRALWFSRYPLPYLRGATDGERFPQHRYWYHLGVYLFRAAGLRRFAGWPRSPLEKAESLEQLRVLEHGDTMRIYETKARTVSVDTPEDLKKLERWYR